MTKARSKAARRRSKRAITLPGGETVPQPATQGRRADLEPQEAADVVALTTRARLSGCRPDDARDILTSDDVGRCIRYMRPDAQDRRNLLAVWQGISAAWANYCARILSLTPSPQCASLPMMPDPMQTDPSLRVDLRTADEKDAAARRAWDAWSAAFNALPVEQALIITSAATGSGPTLWRETDEGMRPTRYGALAVKALLALHEQRTGA